MLELGEKSKVEHYKLGKYVKKNKINLLITRGEKARYIAKGALEEGMKKDKVFVTNNNEKAGKILKNNVKIRDTILIKGSRAVKMEKIIDIIT